MSCRYYLGFLIPVGVLISLVATNDFIADFLAIREIIVNTLIMAGVAALVIMVLSSFIVVTATFRCGSITRKLALFASTGYAFPGNYCGYWCSNFYWPNRLDNLYSVRSAVPRYLGY